MSARCSSCGAAIIWARTRNNKRMPIDAEPVDGGNIFFDDDGTVTVVRGKIPEFTTAHKSHFVTCPQAAQHRRPK